MNFSLLTLPFFSLFHLLEFPLNFYLLLFSKNTSIINILIPFVLLPLSEYITDPQHYLINSAIAISWYSVSQSFIIFVLDYCKDNYFDTRGFIVYTLTLIEYIILYLVRNNPYHIFISYIVYYTITTGYLMCNTTSPTLPFRQMSITTFYMSVVMAIYIFSYF